MSNPSALGSVEYEAESSWGEDVTTFTTHRIPVLGAVDCSGLTHAKSEADRVVQYRNDGTQDVLMTMGGSFKTKIDLAGHGATTAGTPSVDALETFLAIAFGNVANAPASTTASAGTATAPTTAASATFTPGAGFRLGVLGDGKGNGQFGVVSTHITTTLTSLVAFDGAPTSSDVVYGAYTIYPSEGPTTTTVTGTRFRLLTANLRYECHGCYPMAISLTGLNTSERPQIEVTWGVSWWRYSTGTFPSVVTSNQYNPSANASGSLFVADFGTATRTKRVCRNFTLDYTLGMEMLMGPGGVNQYQACVGARRTPDKIKVSWTEDADAATTSPVLPGYGTATTYKHLLYTLSPNAGSAVGIYLPRLAVTNVATQMADSNINRLKIEAKACCSTTTTSDMTLSAARIFFA